MFVSKATNYVGNMVVEIRLKKVDDRLQVVLSEGITWKTDT